MNDITAAAKEAYEFVTGDEWGAPAEEEEEPAAEETAPEETAVETSDGEEAAGEGEVAQ